MCVSMMSGTQSYILTAVECIYVCVHLPENSVLQVSVGF